MKQYNKKFSEENAKQLLCHLKELARKLGHTPSCKEVNAEESYKHHIYMSCFGSMRKAQQLAGLKPNRSTLFAELRVFSSGLVTKKMCLADIKRMESKLGSYPSYGQLKQYGRYPFSVYLKHLGGMKWMKALPV